MGDLSRRPRGRFVAACAVSIGCLAAGSTARESVPVYGAVVDGPSVPLSYISGASPYSGIGRYEGHSACTAFFVDTSAQALNPREAPAYALTAGRCVASHDVDDAVIDAPGSGRVIFNYFADSTHWQIAVPVARVAYATVSERDLAVLELAASYGDLLRQVIRPWLVTGSRRAIVGDPIAIVGVPLGGHPSQSYLRLSACRIDGVAPVLLQGRWHWLDAHFNHCRDIAPSSAGSPVISFIDRVVVGTVSATAIGAPPSNATYMTLVAHVSACFDARGRFSTGEPGCPLDTVTHRHGELTRRRT